MMMPSSSARSRPPIDLSPAQVMQVRHILNSVLTGPESQTRPALAPKVWIFGTRATGRARPYSDLDVLVSSAHPFDWRIRANLADAFEGSDLPFRVDVVEESRLPPGMVARVLAERQPL